MVARGSVFWFVCSVIAALVAGYFAYCDPQKFAGVVDLLATIISILVGVSLAVIAVLNSPFSVSSKHTRDEAEADRMTSLVKQDDDAFSDGQLVLFRVYYAALFFALVFKWVTTGEGTEYELMRIRLLAATTAAIGVLAFCWSARLPLMLREISRQRRSLG